MKYTFEEMQKFLSIYDDEKYGSFDKFVRKMKEFGVLEEESSLIWQSFDVIEFGYLFGPNAKKLIQ